MATEVEEPTFSGDSLPTTKAAVLLVVGEPISPAHKELILAEIAKGFQTWDVEGTGVDINDELTSIANSASAGEEGPEGERVIRRSSPVLQLEILVNPQLYNVRLGLKTFLTTPSQHKHLIYAGHGFQGSGAWVLQDDTFTFQNFAQVFRDPDVENALKQQEGGTLSLHCFTDGEWSNANFAKQDFGKILKISVNPEGKKADNSGILRFVAYVGNFVEGRSLNKLLPASDVVGSIRFNKPTMYVFPGCQGDSALFGISGFNFLVNGGYSRKACFWDFTRHLDRIDAMLLTHLGPDNLFGVGSVLERKAVENIHPEIGFVYVNASEKAKHSPNGDLAPEEGGLLKGSSLKINLSEECSRLMEYCKQIGQTPHPSTRASKGDHLDPVNLYHKVGHGSLDLYVLNPVQDSKEIKEYFQHWSKNAGQFGVSQGLPLQNVLSTCALLVWTPTNQSENITRIFFPGNAPQNKIIEGLEKVKNFDFLKHATCSYKDLHAKPIRKGGIPSKSSRPASAKPSTLSSPRESARREKPEKIEKPKLASTLKASKGIKEDNNKKVVKDKKDKQKSPNKTPNGSPAKSSTGTPGRGSPPSAIASFAAAAPVASNLIEILPEPAVEEPISTDGLSTAADIQTEDLLGQLSTESGVSRVEPACGEPVNNELDSPEPLPDPDAYQPGTVLMPEKAEETMAMVDEQVAMSKTTMEELGIYDDDAEFPEDEIHAGFQNAGFVNNIQDDFDKTEEEEEEPDNEIGAFENDNPEAEEIQPEALPEPIATPQCYASGPDVIPGQLEEDSVKTEPKEIDRQFGEDLTESFPQEQGVKTEERPELEEFANTEEIPNTQFTNEIPDEFSAKIEQESSPMIESAPAFEADAGNNIGQDFNQYVENNVADSNEPTEFDKQDMSADNLGFEQTQEECIEQESYSDQAEQVSVDLSEKVEDDHTPVQSECIEDESSASQQMENYPDQIQQEENYPDQIQKEENYPEKVQQEKNYPEKVQQEENYPEKVQQEENYPEKVQQEENYPEKVQQEENYPDQTQVPADLSEKVEDDDTPVQSECIEDESSESQKIENYPDKIQKEENYPDQVQQEVNYPDQTQVSADLSEKVEDDHTPVQSECIEDESSESQKIENYPDHIQKEENYPDQVQQEENYPDQVQQEEDYPDQIQVSVDLSDKVEDDHTPVQSECIEDESSASQQMENYPDQIQKEENYPDQIQQEENYPDQVQQEMQGDFLDEVNESQQPGISAGAENEETEITEQTNSDSDEGIDATEIEITRKEELISEEIPASKPQTDFDPVPQNLDVTEPESTSIVTDLFANGHDAQEFEQYEESSIPAAFEKDETPELMVTSAGPAIGQAELQSPLTPDSGEVSDLVPSGDDQHQEFELKGDTDSLEGDAENEKDIDEACYDSSQLPEANGFSQPSVDPQDTNPFASNSEEIPDMHQTPLEQGGMNPFFGIDNSQKTVPTGGAHQFEDDSETDQSNQPFNPLKEWGEPMGLPSPMLGDAATNGTAEKKDKLPKAKSAKNGTSKTADSKTAKKPDPTKRPTPNKQPSKLTEKKPASAQSKTTKTVNGESKTSRSLLVDKKTSSKLTNTVEKKLVTKVPPRPATAPSRTESKKPAEKTDIPKARPARRPASAATIKATPPAIKTLPLPPHTTFYVDLTYIPAHGDPHYCDAEFFRRVRARHYVLSALSPTSHALNALMEAKKTWEDKDLEVTVIPTYDNETLRHWMGLHKEQLQDLKIDVAPAASRCTIQLQDHETSCSAYRMEF